VLLNDVGLPTDGSYGVSAIGLPADALLATERLELSGAMTMEVGEVKELVSLSREDLEQVSSGLGNVGEGTSRLRQPREMNNKVFAIEREGLHTLLIVRVQVTKSRRRLQSTDQLSSSHNWYLLFCSPPPPAPSSRSHSSQPLSPIKISTHCTFLP
jgi:hypothetical protein